MPSAVPTGKEKITKFTNCRLVIGNELVEQDLWVSSATGKIVRSQEIFYGENVVPDITIDLGGKIIAPGLIDVQLNGAFCNVGPVAARLIARATFSQAGMVAVGSYQEMRAARKLVKRGTFVQFGTLPFFFLAERLP